MSHGLSVVAELLVSINVTKHAFIVFSNVNNEARHSTATPVDSLFDLM